MNGFTWNCFRRAVALSVLALACIALRSVDLSAQSWDHTYGSSSSFLPSAEDGHRGVQQTADGGFIAVGTTSKYGTKDIYVVKTDLNGAQTWAQAYNIGGDDEGRAIRECSVASGGGYIITGTTDNAGPNPCQNPGGNGKDIFLLRISSAGTVLWTGSYGLPNSEETAFDVIQTTIGGGGMAAGDFVVAGSHVNNAIPKREGYLLRTDQLGALRWDRTYGGATLGDYFVAVIEAVIPGVGGVGSGDIVAVGATNSFQPPIGGFGFNTANAWIVRVNPANGLIGPAPQGSAVYKVRGNTPLFSVRELQTGQTSAGFTSVPGDLVVTGSISIMPNQFSDILIMRVGANPCLLKANVRYGNGTYFGIGHDLQEILNSGVGPIGDIVVVGSTGEYSNPNDNWMMSFNPANLGPAAIPFTTYGNVSQTEDAWSVSTVSQAAGGTPGFIICGTQWGNSIGSGGDTSQLYLVRTNTTGATLCSHSHTRPVNGQELFSQICNAPALVQLNSYCQPPVTSLNLLENEGSCFSASKRAINNDAEYSNAITGTDHALNIFPNPMKPGQDFTLHYSAAAAGTLNVTVADMTGRIVYNAARECTSGDCTFTIKSDGWQAGSYLVKIDDGTTSRSEKIIVADTK